ncbi:hypothetical protein EDB85DRAFT_1560004 [Lactarius pseudohatsudake]|nr:hypothetical protein EDB85DRAFT_1560004 [Lactarius pseudohatsudake]
MFGNSNLRGPIWLAVNLLLIENLQRFYQYFDDELQVECPTSSDDYMNLLQVRVLAKRSSSTRSSIFFWDIYGRRALNRGNQKLDFDSFFREVL